MKLTKEQKAARRAAFLELTPAKKADHIFTYYKWPIILTIVALIIAGSLLHRQMTKKTPVVYLAMINTSFGEDLTSYLTDRYLSEEFYSLKKQEVYLYQDLYLSDNADTLNHEYAYASRIKVLGTIQAQKLDLVLMNKEGYDLLSQSGYLADLSELLSGLDGKAGETAASHLISNTVILEDNLIDYQLNEADEHIMVTEEAANALELTDLPPFSDIGMTGSLYLGVIANTPRSEEALRYITYLLTYGDGESYIAR